MRDINMSNICILYYITCTFTYLTRTHEHTPKVTHSTSTTCLLLDLVCITRVAQGLALFSSINRVFYIRYMESFQALYF